MSKKECPICKGNLECSNCNGKGKINTVSKSIAWGLLNPLIPLFGA